MTSVVVLGHRLIMELPFRRQNNASLQVIGLAAGRT
jgi:hypothetical protein